MYVHVVPGRSLLHGNTHMYMHVPVTCTYMYLSHMPHLHACTRQCTCMYLSHMPHLHACTHHMYMHTPATCTCPTHACTHKHIRTRRVESLLGVDVVGVIHPEVAVVAGGQAGAAGKGHMVANRITTAKRNKIPINCVLGEHQLSTLTTITCTYLYNTVKHVLYNMHTVKHVSFCIQSNMYHPACSQIWSPDVHDSSTYWMSCRYWNASDKVPGRKGVGLQVQSGNYV